ncbi:hypothetical protein WG907_12595 [Sphingobium sp. AN558]|uniref:hypothetical protein n=1 Tax=Sphingobium sp. AN558 TaxID=3133442 RepID=UPI0030BC238A
MKDDFAREVAAQGDDDAIRAILMDVCALAHMGFAAVARGTEERWIACQLLDRIEFGLEPGAELEIKTTICEDIRQSGQRGVMTMSTPTSNGRRITRPCFTASRAMHLFRSC